MFVHPVAVRQAALALIAAGHNDCEISRRLGVPRETIRDWRRVPARAPRHACWRCWRTTSPVRFEAADYAELLGLYLGDGHISVMPRTQRFRLFLDARYPVIVNDAQALLQRVFPGNRVGRHLRGAMFVLWMYHSHLSCLFPQHGPAKKHERPIVLEPWQDAIVATAPWAFLRGCIRSDGCVFVNRTGKYAYPSYEFKNLSAGIRELFARTCASVDVACCVNGNRIAIYRRASVALMQEHVGGKS